MLWRQRLRASVTLKLLATVIAAAGVPITREVLQRPEVRALHLRAGC
jgi:hypothetical protein